MPKEKHKILIVDDDETIKSLYVEVFGDNNYTVFEAKDGVEGLDSATKNLPDIIFTGIIMPRMDGFALKEALSKNVATSKIPVVMSSHMGREEDRKKAIEMGIKNFFVVGLISPKAVVAQVDAIFKSNEYRLELDDAGTDAFRLASDLKLEEGFICPKCHGKAIFVLRGIDLAKKEFSANIICPNCDENK